MEELVIVKSNEEYNESFSLKCAKELTEEEKDMLVKLLFKLDSVSDVFFTK